MSSLAIDTTLKKPLGLFGAYIGKKLVMVVTGVMLVGYIVGHMIGNLQIFLGPEQINQYAAFLHSQENLLWGVRVVLIAALALHLWSSFLLWLDKRRARPIAYVKKDDIAATYASRTMMWSGPIVGAFVVFHILHLTVGSVGLGFKEPESGAYFAYQNVVSGFQHPVVSIAYIVALSLLCLHLYHGMWSMFQSVGISHPRYTERLKKLCQAAALLVAAGFISIPIYVMVRFGVK